MPRLRVKENSEERTQKLKNLIWLLARREGGIDMQTLRQALIESGFKNNEISQAINELKTTGRKGRVLEET